MLEAFEEVLPGGLVHRHKLVSVSEDVLVVLLAGVLKRELVRQLSVKVELPEEGLQEHLLEEVVDESCLPFGAPDLFVGVQDVSLVVFEQLVGCFGQGRQCQRVPLQPDSLQFG